MILALLFSTLSLACRATRGSTPPVDLPTTPDVALSTAPFATVECAYKERLDQPYVFLELTGSYALTGRSLPEVARLMHEQGLVAAGPPFALFYDDPGEVPLERLRARIGFPVEGVVQPAEPLRGDVLESATVAYALVGGAYPEVPRSYPGLLAYVKKMHWTVSGPIREIYLVEPGAVRDWSQLRCEVQVPVGMAP
ncbi:MAG: GyrI-like domain-containing protein [Planctomycetes bacterium]|nr:GyrI-like domain-containing protein [Planctomycetota bacterium]